MSIFKRKRKTAKNGYIYEVQLYYTDKGVKKRYTKSGFTTKKLAQEHEAMILEQIKVKGSPVKEVKRTLSDVYEEFLKVGSVDFQPTTMYNTKRYYNRFKDDLGNMNISEIDYKTLQAWFNTRDQEGLETNKNIKKAINRIFNYAIKCNYIQNNPCKLVTCVGIEKHQNREEVMQYDDFLILTNALYNYEPKTNRKTDLFKYKSYSIAVQIAYFTGARVSEVLALTKNDIDFENRSVSFNKKLQTVGLKAKDFYVMEKMKSKTSKGSVPLADDLKETLSNWFMVNPYETICCKEDGSYIDPAVMDGDIGAVAKEKGIRYFFHMLRHTFSTNIVTNGVDIKTAQELMRHASANTTLTVYTHINEKHKLDTLNNVFNKKHVISTLSNENDIKKVN